MDIKNKNSRYSYDTLSEAVNGLQGRGYTHDFLHDEHSAATNCGEPTLVLSPDEFMIDEVHRFEGMTDPADQSIVFAISSKIRNLRGLVINGFGADFGHKSSELVKSL